MCPTGVAWVHYDRLAVRILFRGIALGIVLAWHAAPAAASDQCVIVPKPEELYGATDLVFRGTAVAARPTGNEGAAQLIAELREFRAALPDLRKALNDSSANVRQFAQRAIDLIGKRPGSGTA